MAPTVRDGRQRARDPFFSLGLLHVSAGVKLNSYQIIVMACVPAVAHDVNRVFDLRVFKIAHTVVPAETVSASASGNARTEANLGLIIGV